MSTNQRFNKPSTTVFTDADQVSDEIVVGGIFVVNVYMEGTGTLHVQRRGIQTEDATSFLDVVKDEAGAVLEITGPGPFAFEEYHPDGAIMRVKCIDIAGGNITVVVE